MKTILFVLTACLLSISSLTMANDMAIDAVKMEKRAFANKYFEIWNNTQRPKASKHDLENYLLLLSEDVAWQHLPYQPDDTRKPNGKQVLRDGMTQWLRVNTEYTAVLDNVIVGQDVIVLKFRASVKFANSDGQIVSKERDYTDVLELDKGKVSVIRRYGK